MRSQVRFRALLARWQARRWLRGCAQVGAGAWLHGKPTIGNGERIRIGERFRLASIPSPSHLIAGPAGDLEVGDGVSIAHGAAIAAHARVTIGAGTSIAPYVVVLDTDFHAVGDRSNPGPSEPIAIGRGVRIGSRVTVLRGAEIGDGAVVAAGSVVAGKVPAGARVSGVPARESALLRRGPVPGSGRDHGSELETAPGVPEMVMHSFGLSAVPAPGDGPSQIAAWDSLGALRLLLALEEVFGLTLREDEVMRAVTVAGLLTAVVDRAVAAAARAAAA